VLGGGGSVSQSMLCIGVVRMIDDLCSVLGEARPRIAAACNASRRLALCTVLHAWVSTVAAPAKTRRVAPPVRITVPATSSPKKENNSELKATAQSVVAVAPANDDGDDNVDPEGGDTAFPAERERGRKRRKRSAAAADEIDALFDDVIGRKVVRSALESVPAPAPAVVKSVTKKADLTLQRGRGRGDQGVNKHADLDAVVDAIKIAPHREGKKRSKRRLDPT
jgi:hypothetical protein